MDDIFYMSEKKISITDIAEAARSVNVKSTFIPQTSDVLQVEYSDGIMTEWFFMKVEEFQEMDDKKFLSDNKISSIFCISFHVKDFVLILPHIKILLERYGGCIGNDSEGFQPIFNLHNIDFFIIHKYDVKVKRVLKNSR